MIFGSKNQEKLSSFLSFGLCKDKAEDKTVD